MSKKDEKQVKSRIYIKRFEQAQLKKMSNLAFDVAKSIFVAGYASFFIDKWSSSIDRISILLVFIASTWIAILIGIKYLKKYYEQNHDINH